MECTDITIKLNMKKHISDNEKEKFIKLFDEIE